MTLTLQHEEVQQYFDMKDDLAYYKARCQELEETVENYRIHFNTPDPEPCEPEEYTTTEHATGFSRPKDMTYSKANKEWDDDEYDTIRYLFNHKGTYSNEPFADIAAELFPERSVAAVYTKLREFGFRIKYNCIIYPIKLDRSKFPS